MLGQLKVIPSSNNGNPLEKVVKSIIGEGVKVFNITSNVSDNLGMFGTFTDSLGLTGLKKGIILTTGKATNANGPNNNTIISEVRNLPGDAQLTALLNTTITKVTRDACVIEFDFKSLSDTLRLNYIFGSDEYNEFVKDIVIDRKAKELFDDVAAIFLSDQSTNRNIAILPNVPFISISNINNGYTLNDSTLSREDCKNCRYLNFNPRNSIATQYDGYTIVLTAMAIIEPCKKYHLKIAIQDTKDGEKDSGILIGAGTFEEKILSSGNASLEDNLGICQKDISPVLKAHGSSVASNWFYNGSLLGNNTNTLSTDAAGLYKLITTVAGGCIWEDSVNLMIGSNFEAFASPDRIFCSPDITKDLFVTTSQPDSIYRYVWSPELKVINAASATTKTVLLDTTTNFIVRVTNQGGCSIYDTSKIISNPILYNLKVFAQDSILCPGTETKIFSDLKTTACKTYALKNISPKQEAPTGPGWKPLSLANYSVSEDIDIGFGFNFYCKTYSKVTVSADGNLQFGSSEYKGLPEIIPGKGTLDNFIALASINLNTGSNGEKIRYKTIGSAPKRQFIVFYDEVPISGGSNGDVVSGQIKLFEDSSKIEIHTIKVINTAPQIIVQGIENADGSKGIVVPGRNKTAWESTTGDAWAFVPITESSIITWSNQQGMNLGSKDTLSVSPFYTTSYIRVVQSEKCKIADTVKIEVLQRSLGITNSTAICLGDSIILSVSGANKY